MSTSKMNSSLFYSKKASLKISVNTIVLLVLAFVLLGIFIGAFTGIFNSSREKLLDSILKIDAGPKATSYDVLAGGDAYKIQRNKDQIIVASFYNDGHSECVESAELTYWCGTLIPLESYDTLLLSVPIGEERTIGGVLKIDKSIARKDFICNLRVHCGPDHIVVAEQHTVFKIV